jgi:hypothetical protein
MLGVVEIGGGILLNAKMDAVSHLPCLIRDATHGCHVATPKIAQDHRNAPTKKCLCLWGKQTMILSGVLVVGAFHSPTDAMGFLTAATILTKNLVAMVQLRNALQHSCSQSAASTPVLVRAASRRI